MRALQQSSTLARKESREGESIRGTSARRGGNFLRFFLLRPAPRQESFLLSRARKVLNIQYLRAGVERPAGETRERGTRACGGKGKRRMERGVRRDFIFRIFRPRRQLALSCPRSCCELFCFARFFHHFSGLLLGREGPPR